MAVFAVGPQGGQAVGSPDYKIYKYTQTYTKDDIDAGAVFFPRVTGPQRITMTCKVLNVVVGAWSFSLNGGTNQTTTNCLPMFPNTASTYNPSINYSLDPNEIPPLGCTVEMQPIPQNKTISRINIFNVTDNSTGNSYVFRLGMCPFLNIETSIESIGPVLLFDTTITITSEFYRVTPNLRTNGVPISMMSPSYRTIAYVTDIPPDGGNSPLDDPSNKVPFTRFNGQQTIVFINSDINFFFVVDVDYGIIGQGNSYIGYVDPTANCKLVKAPINCTATTIETTPGNTAAVNKVVTVQVTTPAADGGGRVYLLAFSPYAFSTKIKGGSGDPPTISMSSGAPIGNVEVAIQVFGRYFRTV